ncbi:MAG: hypothetical protein WBQ43_05680 [Terriglobales bacterium]
MQYFTKELWQSAQEPGKLDEYNANWQIAYDQYQQQLMELRQRVGAEAYRFFAEADLHDGALVRLELEGGSARNYSHPVSAKLIASEASNDFLWEISYRSLRHVLIDHPSQNPLFYSPGEGFGDWGYHELSDAGDGFLRHEILFATGSVIAFEFKEFSVKRQPRT